MAMLPFNMVSPEEYLGEADFPGNGIKGEALDHGFIEVFTWFNVVSMVRETGFIETCW